MLLSLKLITPVKEIENLILQTMSDELNKHIYTISEIVKSKFTMFIKSKIQNSAEYDSLINGKLKAEFGLDDAQSRVNRIISEWISIFNIKITKVKPKVRTITGGLSINAIPSDFENVIRLAEATVFSKGGEVPWLKWLLLEGYKLLIADYDIRYGSYPRSRTGEAQMYKRPGNFYTVPAEFAGTIDDNWITRLFDGVDSEIYTILIKAVDGVL